MACQLLHRGSRFLSGEHLSLHFDLPILIEFTVWRSVFQVFAAGLKRLVFVAESGVVTNMTPRPSFIVSINLARIATTILTPLKNYKNVRSPLFSSGDIQKLEVLYNEGFRVTKAASREDHQSRRALCAPRRHTTPQSAYAVARREPPLADARRNPSPGTALRSFLYNASGRAANGGRLCDPAHLWRAGRLVP